MYKQGIVVTLLSIASVSFAADLGVHGRLYDIEEADMRKTLIGQASEVDWASKNQALAEDAKNWGANLPQFDLPKASETKTTYIDPSITLASDINAPVEQEDGSWEWQLLHPAGTKVNPLEQVRPINNMLFFDGDDEEQVEFALAALKAKPYKLMLVETSGNPDKLSKKILRPIYYANAKILERFGIRQTPSLLGVGEDLHRFELAVTTFATPYDVTMIDKAWHGLPEKGVTIDEN